MRSTRVCCSWERGVGYCHKASDGGWARTLQCGCGQYGVATVGCLTVHSSCDGHGGAVMTCPGVRRPHSHTCTRARPAALTPHLKRWWLCGYVLTADSLLCGLHAGRVAARTWRIASWWWVGLTVSGEGRGLGHGACACAWEWARAWGMGHEAWMRHGHGHGQGHGHGHVRGLGHEHGACAWA